MAEAELVRLVVVVVNYKVRANEKKIHQPFLPLLLAPSLLGRHGGEHKPTAVSDWGKSCLSAGYHNTSSAARITRYNAEVRSSCTISTYDTSCYLVTAVQLPSNPTTLTAQSGTRENHGSSALSQYLNVLQRFQNIQVFQLKYEWYCPCKSNI